MTELKKMWDFCPDPSDAVRAMVSGLRAARGKKNFFLAMKYYAHVESLGEEKICYGCAGTCAILEALDLWPRMREYAASRGRGNAAEVESLAGVNWTDLLQWELAIDYLRGGRDGKLGPLRKYYGVDISKYANLPVDISKYKNLPSYLPLLGTSYSEAELQKYEAFAAELKTAGL